MNYNELNDLVNQHTDTYVWFKFNKSCGYYVVFPFLLDDSIQSLYRHIDVLWKYNTNNIIWIVKEVIKRGDPRTIREYIYDNDMHKHDYDIFYHVYFETNSNNFNNLINHKFIN